MALSSSDLYKITKQKCDLLTTRFRYAKRLTVRSSVACSWFVVIMQLSVHGFQLMTSDKLYRRSKHLSLVDLDCTLPSYCRAHTMGGRKRENKENKGAQRNARTFSIAVNFQHCGWENAMNSSAPQSRCQFQNWTNIKLTTASGPLRGLKGSHRAWTLLNENP